MDISLLTAILVVILYGFSCVSLSMGFATRFQDPLGKQRLTLPALTGGNRFLKFLLVALSFLIILLFTFLSLVFHQPFSFSMSLILATFMGMMINACLIALFPPVIRIGSEGLRINQARIPWEEILHWERLRSGIIFYRVNARRKLARGAIHIQGKRLADAERIFFNCARQIPPEGFSPRCVSCGTVNSFGLSTCSHCQQPLVSATFLRDWTRRSEKRHRRFKFLFFITFMLLVFVTFMNAA